MKQKDKIWSKKVTKLYLEAYLLREEGIMKHLICRYMTIRSGHDRYIKGNCRCNHCSAKFGIIKDFACPCCGYQLRRHCRWVMQSGSEVKMRESHYIE